jgi:hypothetical protein
LVGVVGELTILPVPEGSWTPVLFLPGRDPTTGQGTVLALDPRARIHDLATGECVYDGRAECCDG